MVMPSFKGTFEYHALLSLDGPSLVFLPRFTFMVEKRSVKSVLLHILVFSLGGIHTVNQMKPFKWL